MKFGYFPFTYISDTTAKILMNGFPQILVYQPCETLVPENMKTLAEDQIIALRFPPGEDPRQFEKALADYKAWASMHQKSGFTHFKGLSGTPFYGDTYTSKIRSEIRQYQTQQPGDTEPPDPLFQARLFLQMAQEFDLQNDELTQDLASYKHSHSGLIQLLKGDGGEEDLEQIPITPATEPVVREDPGSYHPLQRLRHWAQMVLCDPDPAWGYITHSPLIIEQVLETIPEAIEVRTLQLPQESSPDLEPWKHQFLDSLTQLIGTSWNPDRVSIPDPPAIPTGGRFQELKLFVVPDQPPQQVFHRFTKDQPVPEPQSSQGKNTVIALAPLS